MQLYFSSKDVNACPGDGLLVSGLLRMLQLPQLAALSSCTDALKHHFERQPGAVLQTPIVNFARLTA